MGIQEDQELSKLEVERQRFMLEMDKSFQPLHSKVQRVETALRVIEVLNGGYVADKILKDEATNLAAKVLTRELKDF
jgi:hypothetical protein